MYRIALIIFAVALVACNGPVEIFGRQIAMDTLSRQQAIDFAWQALAPYTSSHERTNWKVIEATLIAGENLPEVFKNPRDLYCFSGTPPADESIQANADYWYIIFEPVPATESPQVTRRSPTEPPHVPEPFTRQAFLLIDNATGKVAAFRLHCVVY